MGGKGTKTKGPKPCQRDSKQKKKGNSVDYGRERHLEKEKRKAIVNSVDYKRERD